MSQLFNSELDYGEIQGTIVWDNDFGYIETEVVHPKKYEYVIKSSVSIAYSFSSIFRSHNRLTIGLQYNKNQLYYKQDLGISSLPNKSVDIVNPNFVIGIMYDILELTIPKIRFSVFYENNVEFEKFDDQWVIGYIPEKLHIGILAELNSKLDISCNHSSILWENLDRENSTLKNNNNLSINFSYRYSDNLKMSCGIFSTDHVYGQYDNIFNLNHLRAIYIVAGFQFSHKSFLIDLSLSDSQLFSDKWRKQTIFKVGVGYSM